MAKNRICLTCGAEYQYCPNCSGAKDVPAWKTEFDEESCKDIFNVISGYNMNIIPAKDVVAVLKKYNITDTSKYKKSIRTKLNEAIETVEATKSEERTDNKPKFEKKSYK